MQCCFYRSCLDSIPLVLQCAGGGADVHPRVTQECGYIVILVTFQVIYIIVFKVIITNSRYCLISIYTNKHIHKTQLQTTPMLK
jgi:galactokinase/mevalonate kinase-like predicted kinase